MVLFKTHWQYIFKKGIIQIMLNIFVGLLKKLMQSTDPQVLFESIYGQRVNIGSTYILSED